MLFSACSTPTSKKESAPSPDSSLTISNNKEVEILLKDKCLPCHSLDMRKVGPPLIVFTDTVGEIIEKYKAKTAAHKKTKVSAQELQLIESYVRSFMHIKS